MPDRAFCEQRIDHPSYGFGVGTIVLPNGSQVAVYQDDDELADALLFAATEAWDTYVKEKGNTT